MNWYKYKIFSKLFLTTTEWNVAWKRENDDCYNVIINPDGYWLADSLLFGDTNCIYLFVEAYEKEIGLGRIGVFRFDGIKFTDFRVILKQPYHLSYPYVFKYKNEYYMIPESSAIKTVQLYKAVEFPMKWEKISVLIYGNYVDTTVTPINESEYQIYTYDMDKSELVTAILNMKDRSMIILNRFDDPQYLKRAGGNVFEIGDNMYRALQNNTYFYGQSLSIVDCKKNEIYEIITPEKIKCTGGKSFRRVHTYSNVMGINAIDLSNYKFNIFKVFEKLRKYI